MSPRPADPLVRAALIDAAAQMIASHEPVSIGRLAAEVGTSTMAVYTHFGSMEVLYDAVRDEGFERLAGHLRAVRPTRDPVADLVALGWSYVFNALSSPSLYRVMFLEDGVERQLSAAVEHATFVPLIEVVGRCMDAGRFDRGNVRHHAVDLWMMNHGTVTATLTGLLTVEDMGAHLRSMFVAQFVGLGDDPTAAARSMANGIRRMDRRVGRPPKAAG